MFPQDIGKWAGLATIVGTALLVGVPGLPKPQIPAPWDQYLLVVTTIAAAVQSYFITPTSSIKKD